MKLLCVLGLLSVIALAAPIEPVLLEQMAQVKDGEKLGVMIVMTEQFDGENIIRTIKDKEQRWEVTVTGCKSLSARSQAGLLSELAKGEAAGLVAGVTSLWIVNAVYCEATPAVIRTVADRSDVWFVQWDKIPTENALGLGPATAAGTAAGDVLDGSFTVEWNVRKVKADSVWAVYGYTGEGVIVGDIDTGCDYTHPDLSDHMWTDANYPNHGWNFEQNNNNPMDAHGHGTHTCGTVAGDGTGGDTTGMAPSAQIMTCRTKTSISQPYPDTIAENTVLNSMQFCVAPPLSPANHAHLLTMSLGWIISAWNPRQAVWRAAVTNVAAAGLPYFIAAGNEGAGSPPMNLRCPGHAPDPWKHPADTTGGLSGSISIGATDNSDNIASFSSQGPVTWATIDPYNDYTYPPGLLKPSFSAPGVNVTSTRLGGGYTQMSGTSMATPCAAGVAALILEKNPGLLPEEVDEIMQNSVQPLGAQPKNNTYGTGRIDAMLCIENTPLPGPRHDVAVGPVLSPAEKIDPLVPLAPVVVVKNRGTYPEPSVVVYCKVESLGTQVYQQNVTVSLDSAGTDTATFPNWNVGPGSQTYDLTFWHTLAGDTNRRNDTITASTTTRGHDVATASMNVGSRLRAMQAFTPRITLANPGDYTESGFNAYCRIDSAGTAIYNQQVAVDSVPEGASRSFAFPDWNVGPESATYTVTMWHNCGPDQNRGNDTLRRTTMATASILRVAIEIASGSAGRTPPNACFAIDSLCDAQDWEDSIVVGTDIDEPSELANFDVVVTGDVGYSDNDFPSYQNALLSWVRDGGGFVGLGWGVYGVYRTAGGNSPMDSVMAVMCSGDYGFLTSGTVTITDSTHPITQGVSEFSVYGHGEYAESGMWPGAVQLGSYSGASSQASIAYKSLGAGRSVYLGPIYFAHFGSYNNEPYYQDANSARLLKQAIEWAAWGSSSGIETPVTPAMPTRLEVARPNPARGLPTVEFSLAQAGRASLVVYDLTGRHVRTLASGQLPAGQHSLRWNRLDDEGRRVSAGVYVVRLEAGDRRLTNKIVLR